MTNLYLGLISGTSMDGIDAAIVDLSARPRVLAAKTYPFSGEMRDALAELASASRVDVELLGRTDVALGERFAESALAVVEASGQHPATINAIGSHGQTIRHRPDGAHPFTLQIGDPNVIAERTGITTVADFRRRDIAAGGQGAPLVPAFHAECFRTPEEDRAVLNLGGIANLTILPRDTDRPVTGFDTGPANVLLDGWITRHRGIGFDAGGAWAASGQILQPMLERMMRDPFLGLTPPKSTGRERFHLAWLDDHLSGETPAQADVQATLAAFTVQSVAVALRACAPRTQRLLVCGGGSHNSHLMDGLRGCLPEMNVESTAVYGLDPDWVEAAAFAWMAKETVAGRACNSPSVTGARGRVILGGIYQAGDARREP